MSGFERVGTRRPALVAAFVLPAIPTPFTSIFAAALTILNVETSGALPGFHSADLPRYIAQQMAEARLVSEQAIIEGGRHDPDLAAAVADLTEDLLAHKGRIARSSAYNSNFSR